MELDYVRTYDTYVRGSVSVLYIDAFVLRCFSSSGDDNE